MPKIDTTKIDGYDAMTAEQKLTALEAFEYEEPALDGAAEKYRRLMEKANSDAAEWKKKHNALLTEEQRKEAERLEADKAMKERLETLEKEKSISDSRANYIALGYDEKLAQETAQAFADGDMEKVLVNQRLHIENVKKAVKEELMRKNPRPTGGEPPTGITNKKDFDALTSKEQMDFMTENPNWREIIAK